MHDKKPLNKTNYILHQNDSAQRNYKQLMREKRKPKIQK